ncbi:2-amino-3,7-dideoxy-D-threo-hept-6-ulosonate synthase [Halorutilales archaeon Cl-col2-1]
MIGKEIRLDRIRDRESKNFVIIPMDHGVSIGPVEGLRDLESTVNDIAEGGGDAVLMQKGIVSEGHRGKGRDMGLIVHINAATSLGEPNNKVLVGTVEEAVRRGADAVSVQVNVGSETEPQQLQDLGKVADECEKYGMPLVAMMYVRGHDVDSADVENIAHATRIGAELGADVVKTAYTGDPDEYRQVIEGCPAPVVIAGGPKAETEREVLQDISDAMDVGARGVAMGRNVFQRDNVPSMVNAISSIVHGGVSVDEAMEESGL